MFYYVESGMSKMVLSQVTWDATDSGRVIAQGSLEKIVSFVVNVVRSNSGRIDWSVDQMISDSQFNAAFDAALAG